MFDWVSAIALGVIAKRPPLSGERGSLDLGSNADFKRICEGFEMGKRSICLRELKTRASSSVRRRDIYDHFFLAVVGCPRA
jgi:hypothetical protein